MIIIKAAALYEAVSLALYIAFRVRACQERVIDFHPSGTPFSYLLGKTSLVHDAQFPIDLPPVPDRHRLFLRRLERSQIQRFQQCCIAGKYAPLAVQLPIGGIQ